MERLTKYITPVGYVMTTLNSMRHYKPCVVCREKADIKYKNGQGYTEKFGFCDDCEIKMLFNKLKEYEDLEERGLMLRLPCKVGDTIFALMEDKPKSIEETVCSKMCIEIQAPFPYDNGIKMFFKIEDFGKTVFLTREEAERVLREAKE